MPLSIKKLSLKAPPPRVVLLPDSLFFVRSVPIAEGATAAAVSAQVELALEGMAPFPLAQLYYAHHWVQGGNHALVYAAYRKRFTAEQSEGWGESEAVLPVFAALLGAHVERATTVVLASPDGLTAIHWGERSDLPSAVTMRSWPADTEAAGQRRIREEVLREFGGSRAVIDLNEVPVVDRDVEGADFVFRAGPLVAPYSRAQLDTLDVRDKADLTSRRAARGRDLLLWRTFLLCIAGVALAGLLELGLIGGHVWQRSRNRVMEKQAPVVAEIMRAQTLSNRIDELATKRLRPLEMIALASSRQPGSVVFLRATTVGLYGLDVEATTSKAADVGAYQEALRQLPELSNVEIQNQVNREGVSNFHLILTFKAGAFKS